MEILFYLFYNFLLVIFSPVIMTLIFLRYPKTFIKYFFTGLKSRLGYLKIENGSDVNPIWIHAASLGECRAALPLIEAIKKQYPEKIIIFSSTTHNGIAEARRLRLSNSVFYAPLDIPLILRTVFKTVHPKIILLLESEIWPNWLKIAQEFRVPVGIINGRISQRSANRYLKFQSFSSIMMNKISFICAREKGDAERFNVIGCSKEKLRITGNLKYDSLPWSLNGTLPSENKTFNLKFHDPVWVAGSVREGEEKFIYDSFLTLRHKFPQLKLILAPRHLDCIESNIEMLKKLNLSFILRSAVHEEMNSDWDVMIWDTFGNLWEAYQSATVVYIGGSLVQKGGQNPIEPAWFSKPVLFGPSMENFAEPSKILLESGGAIEVKNDGELSETIDQLLSNPHRIEEMGKKAKESVESFFGLATKKTMEMLRPYLS